MPEATTIKKRKEKQNHTLANTLQVLEELEKEAKMLSEEKINLQNIEKELNLKINEEIENRRQKREQLKTEVVDLRKRCEELTNFLNSHNPDLAEVFKNGFETPPKQQLAVSRRFGDVDRKCNNHDTSAGQN
jgi:predicted  nucleic acid-binding Zn-ribbon protein